MNTYKDITGKENYRTSLINIEAKILNEMLLNQTAIHIKG